MKQLISTVCIVLITVTGLVMAFVTGFSISDMQKDTLMILGIICLVAILYCFIVGELSKNYSQMDKLWSILPIIYVWFIAYRAGFTSRITIMAFLVTLWGIRLTLNFARKGAYTIKFWSGEEDYRWGYLRKNSILRNRLLWVVFNLFFISFYQNALVLAITLPGIAIMESTAPLGTVDLIATLLAIGFLFYEFIADEQQHKFQTEKWKRINSGQALHDLPHPYNKGFNTTGLWAYSRHPNYLGEQMFWVAIYLFVVGAQVAKFGLFHWSIFGSMLLILLFLGSATLSESISSKKYPEYALYRRSLLRYFPFIKFRG